MMQVIELIKLETTQYANPWLGSCGGFTYSVAGQRFEALLSGGGFTVECGEGSGALDYRSS